MTKAEATANLRAKAASQGDKPIQMKGRQLVELLDELAKAEAALKLCYIALRPLAEMDIVGQSLGDAVAIKRAKDARAAARDATPQPET